MIRSSNSINHRRRKPSLLSNRRVLLTGTRIRTEKPKETYSKLIRFRFAKSVIHNCKKVIMDHRLHELLYTRLQTSLLNQLPKAPLKKARKVLLTQVRNSQPLLPTLPLVSTFQIRRCCKLGEVFSPILDSYGYTVSSPSISSSQVFASEYSL